MPKKTLILDSTQIAAYYDCPRLWNFAHRQNLVSFNTPPNDPLLMGTYGHKLLEIYYKSRAKGLGLKDATDKAFNFNVDEEICQICNHTKESHKVSITQKNTNSCSECINFNLNQKDTSKLVNPDHNFQGKPFPLSEEKRKLVRDQFLLYTFTYAQDDFTIPSPENVELGFSHNLYEDDEKLFILEGKIDLFNVNLKNTLFGFVDHKTQSRRHEIYGKSIQFRNYAYVTNAMFGMVNYIRFTKGVTKDTFQRQIINFSSIDHRLWEMRLIGVYHKVYEMLLKAEIFGPKFWFKEESEPKWSSCNGRYGVCSYTPLCEENNERVQLVKVDSLYTKKEEWKPW